MKISKALAWRVIAENAYIVDPRTSELHEMNGTATLIWKLLERGEELEKIPERLCDEFDVDCETAKSDTVKLINRMKELSLLE